MKNMCHSESHGTTDGFTVATLVAVRILARTLSESVDRYLSLATVSSVAFASRRLSMMLASELECSKR